MNKGLPLFSLTILFMGLLSVSVVRAGGFKTALPGYRFSFPRDHGAHDDFQTEWWYYTGHLHASNGKSYGYELTFFRRGTRDPAVLQNPSRWAVRELYLAHFALTDPSGNRFWYREKISREGLGKAGAESSRLRVYIDDWRVEDVENKMLLSARDGGTEIHLELSPEKPVVLQGENGLSRKGPRPQESSYYYSLTRLRTSGTLQVDGDEAHVDGLSWMDHEFFSSPENASEGSNEEPAGWDWFAIQLGNRRELMFYRLRQKDGRDAPFSAGSLVLPDGSTEPLSSAQVRLTPLSWWRSSETNANYPIQWRLEIPDKGITLDLKPLLPQQELITSKSTRIIYWEGALRVEGSWQGGPVSGEGYLEMTGYAGLFPASARGIRSGKNAGPTVLSPPTK